MVQVPMQKRLIVLPGNVKSAILLYDTDFNIPIP